MPERIEPCLALLKARPPKGDNWVYEIKWDGYRLAVRVKPAGVRILTRIYLSANGGQSSGRR